MYYIIVLSFYLWSTWAIGGTTTAMPSVITHSELARIGTGLFVVVLLIVLLSWLIKRFNVVSLSSSKGFESIASMTLGPKERMMLLRVGTRYLLIGVSASSVNILYDFGNKLPDGFNIEQKPSFAEILKSATRKS